MNNPGNSINGGGIGRFARSKKPITTSKSSTETETKTATGQNCLAPSPPSEQKPTANDTAVANNPDNASTIASIPGSTVETEANENEVSKETPIDSTTATPTPNTSAIMTETSEGDHHNSTSYFQNNENSFETMTNVMTENEADTMFTSCFESNVLNNSMEVGNNEGDNGINVMNMNMGMFSSNINDAQFHLGLNFGGDDANGDDNSKPVSNNDKANTNTGGLTMFQKKKQQQVRMQKEDAVVQAAAEKTEENLSDTTTTNVAIDNNSNNNRSLLLQKNPHDLKSVEQIQDQNQQGDQVCAQAQVTTKLAEGQDEQEQVLFLLTQKKQNYEEDQASSLPVAKETVNQTLKQKEGTEPIPVQEENHVDVSDAVIKTTTTATTNHYGMCDDGKTEQTKESEIEIETQEAIKEKTNSEEEEEDPTTEKENPNVTESLSQQQTTATVAAASTVVGVQDEVNDNIHEHYSSGLAHASPVVSPTSKEEEKEKERENNNNIIPASNNTNTTNVDISGNSKGREGFSRFSKTRQDNTTLPKTTVTAIVRSPEIVMGMEEQKEEENQEVSINKNNEENRLDRQTKHGKTTTQSLSLIFSNKTATNLEEEPKSENNNATANTGPRRSKDGVEESKMKKTTGLALPMKRKSFDDSSSIIRDGSGAITIFQQQQQQKKQNNQNQNNNNNTYNNVLTMTSFTSTMKNTMYSKNNSNNMTNHCTRNEKQDLNILMNTRDSDGMTMVNNTKNNNPSLSSFTSTSLLSDVAGQVAKSFFSSSSVHDQEESDFITNAKDKRTLMKNTNKKSMGIPQDFSQSTIHVHANNRKDNVTSFKNKSQNSNKQPGTGLIMAKLTNNNSKKSNNIQAASTESQRQQIHQEYDLGLHTREKNTINIMSNDASLQNDSISKDKSFFSSSTTSSSTLFPNEKRSYTNDTKNTTNLLDFNTTNNKRIALKHTTSTKNQHQNSTSYSNQTFDELLEKSMMDLRDGTDLLNMSDNKLLDLNVDLAQSHSIALRFLRDMVDLDEELNCMEDMLCAEVKEWNDKNQKGTSVMMGM